jgi:hypothetical protein
VHARLREIECLLPDVVCMYMSQYYIHVMLTMQCIAHTTARTVMRTVVRTIVTLFNAAESASAHTAVEHCIHCLCTIDIYEV